MEKGLLRDWKSATVIVMVLALVTFTIFQSIRDYNQGKRNTCATVGMTLRGVMTAFGGRGDLSFIVLDNVANSVGVANSTRKYLHGFNGEYGFELGDSVIKSAGSKLITFKRGDSVAVFELDCGN